MRQKEELIKSKEKRLKLLKENERKCKIENNKLRKKIDTKEAKALSFVDLMEENERLEGNNMNLSQKVK